MFEGRRWLCLPVVLTVVFVAVAASLLAYMLVLAAQKQDQHYHDIYPVATTALSVFCSTHTRLGVPRCNEYVNTVVDPDRTRLDTLMYCLNAIDPVNEGELFANCLTDHRIPLPPTS